MANLLYEKFKINQNVQLNNEDIKSLSLLYLPLMGIDSFAIYSIFSSLKKLNIVLKISSTFQQSKL